MTIKGLFDFDLNFDPIEVADIPSTYDVGHAEVVVLPVPATAMIQIVDGAPFPSNSFAIQHVNLAVRLLS
jgi:hypothetical protein